MHTADDIGEADLRWATRQAVPAILPAQALHQLPRLQLNEDLDQVIRWDSIFLGDLLNPGRLSGPVSAGKRKDGPHGVITFYGELQGWKLKVSRMARKQNSRFSGGHHHQRLRPGVS